MAKKQKPADKQRTNSGKRKPPRGRPFGPGQSGNPAGRPRNELSLTATLRKELARRCPTDPNGRTWLEVICANFLQVAAEGSVGAVRELLDRMEGRVTDRHSGPDDGPIEVRFVPVPSVIEDIEEWTRKYAGSENVGVADKRQ
jgi:hypothetical protein